MTIAGEDQTEHACVSGKLEPDRRESRRSFLTTLAPWSLPRKV